ncbi:hypothetical protein [Candidatus Amarobacter glycogenicus]|uniref:hypothetical protein n=1 Tax=Candidatus Amarobacter glycogenicus TaxID=3140699 RepID=UPI002A0EBEEC|nr:hypothetical protein [Dehalococcoidia bacterium]
MAGRAKIIAPRQTIIDVDTPLILAFLLRYSIQSEQLSLVQYQRPIANLDEVLCVETDSANPIFTAAAGSLRRKANGRTHPNGNGRSYPHASPPTYSHTNHRSNAHAAKTGAYGSRSELER